MMIKKINFQMGGEDTVYNIINNYGSNAYLQNYEVTQ